MTLLKNKVQLENFKKDIKKCDATCFLLPEILNIQEIMEQVLKTFSIDKNVMAGLCQNVVPLNNPDPLERTKNALQALGVLKQQ